jgi:outer membrane protein OmpA-like peptidoglycan-associated protein
MSRIKHIIVPGVLALLLAGCGGPPANNPLLQEARSTYNQARNNPEVVAHAIEDLEEAERILLEGEELHRSRRNADEVSHYAYVARQRVRIAEQRAARRAAEAEIERAERERREVQLQARTAEADQATEAARESQQRAEEAARRAEQLAERVRELEAERTERGLVLTLGDVLFDVGRAELLPGAQREIDRLATFLREYENRNVLIEGFTDNTGSASMNLDLSQRRADAVRQALLERGINDRRIRTRGYGIEYPVAPNNTAAGRQRNRRVEIVISDDAGQIPDRTR